MIHIHHVPKALDFLIHLSYIYDVDSEDKIICYRNWLGLMKGDLKSKFEKEGKLFERKLKS